MKTKEISCIKTKLPSKAAFTIETDPDFIKLHTLMVVNGKRGGGKSVALANLISEAKRKHYFDRVFLITPTYNSNKTIWDIADIKREDVHEPSTSVIKDVIAACEAEKEEWDKFLAEKEKYKKYNKDIKDRAVCRVHPEELMAYLDLGFLDGKVPEWKYAVEQPPRLAIILDDCLNSDVMAKRTAGLTNLAIRHRHCCDGLGVSMFFLVQSYCALGGVPRVIRENCTHLLLFKINDQKQILKIKEESDLEITDDEFTEMLDTAHSEPYQFLMIDFSSKCPTKKYRKGFNQYLIPPSLENSCKCNK